jgi:hypothetical protein
LLRDRRGLVFAEAAISLSVLSLTTLGGVEIGRYVLLTQKLDRVAASAADLASQGQTVSVSDLNNIYSATSEILKPFSLNGTGTVIVSSVSATGTNPPVVDWQQVGGGTISVGSAIGTAGGNATLPPELAIRPGEEVIVAEVYYNFTPWLAPNVAPATQLYHRAFFRPRQGLLTTLQP